MVTRKRQDVCRHRCISIERCLKDLLGRSSSDFWHLEFLRGSGTAYFQQPLLSPWQVPSASCFFTEHRPDSLFGTPQKWAECFHELTIRGGAVFICVSSIENLSGTKAFLGDDTCSVVDSDTQQHPCTEVRSALKSTIQSMSRLKIANERMVQSHARMHTWQPKALPSIRACFEVRWAK